MIQRNYKVLLIPVWMFLGIFLLDKFILIPFVFERLVKNKQNVYDGLFKTHIRLYETYLDKWKKKNKSKEEIENAQIIFFGTSRIADIAKTPEYLFINNPYLKHEEQTKNTPAVSWTIRASNFIQIYYSYQYFLEKIRNAKLMILEINYANFNRNALYREKKEIYSLPFEKFFKDYEQFSYRDRLEYFSSHLFVLNMYKLEWKYIFEKRKDLELDETLDFLIQLDKFKEQTTIKSFTPNGIVEGKESEEDIKKYREVLDWVTATFLQNFKLNETEWNLLKKTLQHASENKIPLVLYRPRVHKSLREITKRLLPNEKEWYDSVRELCKTYGIPYVDLDEKGALQCDYFTDPSHIANTCFPEMIEKMNEVYENYYSNKH